MSAHRPSIACPAGGRIDRARPIAVHARRHGRSRASPATRWPRRCWPTASALVGRSFKYHRPRGIMAAGVEEPNALVTLGEGGRREPNIPAHHDRAGRRPRRARRQNALALGRASICMAVNSLAAPLLAAGFYYKTFMGPTRGAWMFYEPFIRRAAGLGKGTFEPDPDRYEDAPRLRRCAGHRRRPGRSGRRHRRRPHRRARDAGRAGLRCSAARCWPSRSADPADAWLGRARRRAGIAAQRPRAHAHDGGRAL